MGGIGRFRLCETTGMTGLAIGCGSSLGGRPRIARVRGENPHPRWGRTSMRYSSGMSEKPSRQVAVILERTAVSSRWVTHQWLAASLIPDVGGEPRVLLERDGLVQKVFPGFTITLFGDEAEGYYLNVSSGEPCAFVSVRTDGDGDDPYPFQVTASYNEAARWMDGGERVDKVAVDLEFAAWVGAWVEANYRPEPKERIKPKSFKGREGRLRERG